MLLEEVDVKAPRALSCLLVIELRAFNNHESATSVKSMHNFENTHNVFSLESLFYDIDVLMLVFVDMSFVILRFFY